MPMTDTTPRAEIQEISPEQLDWIVGAGNTTPPPKPMPPSTLCWNNGKGGLACISEGDVKVQ